MNKVFNYKDEYNRLKEIVEGSLDIYLPNVDRYSSVLNSAMKYSTGAGGKRLRPVLLLAFAAFGGVNEKAALPYACAIEYIHTYSLIHDDHPCMDNDDLRRGKPTNHKVYGDGIALLAGDGLLNSAFDVMFFDIQAAQRADDMRRRIAAAAEISRAAGVQGMIAGQIADFVMTNPNRRYKKDWEHIIAEGACFKTEAATADEGAYFKTEEAAADEGAVLRYIHRNKTGALLRAAVRAGMILAGAGEELLGAVSDYAENLGLVFQIVDDVLDVTGDFEKLGKRTGMDAELGKLTYPGVYGVRRSLEMAEKMTVKAVAAIERAGTLIDRDRCSGAVNAAVNQDLSDFYISFFTELALDLQKRIT